jgi:hypothetical protein
VAFSTRRENSFATAVSETVRDGTCLDCAGVWRLSESAFLGFSGNSRPEGWFEPCVPSPDGSGGAPRQGWINAMDGNLYRLWFFTFAEGFNHGASNAYLGSYTLMTPLSDAWS